MDNVVQAITRTIEDARFSEKESIRQATSACINDMYVNESIASVAGVQQHLADYELLCKEPKHLKKKKELVWLICMSEWEGQYS